MSLHISFPYGIIYARSLIGHRERNKRKKQKGGGSMTEAAAQARKESHRPANPVTRWISRRSHTRMTGRTERLA